jgi:hypothetical protein
VKSTACRRRASRARREPCANFPQAALELLAQLRPRRPRTSAPGIHHEIDGVAAELPATAAKELANPPLRARPHDRVANLLRRRHSEPGSALAVTGRSEQDHMTAGAAHAVTVHTLELGSTAQAYGLRETLVGQTAIRLRP